MEKHAKVVVIGGGVVGCSILFHLAKFGLKTVFFLKEKNLLQAHRGMPQETFM